MLLNTAGSILDMSSVFEHDIESSATPGVSLCHQRVNESLTSNVKM